MKRCLSTGNIDIGGDEVEEASANCLLNRKTRKLYKKSMNNDHPPASSSVVYPPRSTTVIEDIINAVANDNYDIHSTGETTLRTDSNASSSCKYHPCACMELKTQIGNQQLEIIKLVDQMNFVLSFLNITENIENTVLNPNGILDHVTTNKPLNMNTNISDHDDHSNDEPDVAHSIIDQESTATWSIIASKNIVSKYTGGSSTKVPKPVKFNDAVMSAVYADRQDKERRSNSFIVSGLMAKPNITDKESVSQLCNDEFSFSPSIVYCKRLGEVKPGITQPILVALKITTEATDIIARARTLRRSSDPYVKAHVYINPNLTKPEAHAAYLVRCRRKSNIINRSAVQRGPSNLNDATPYDAGTGTGTASAVAAAAAAMCVDAIQRQNTDPLASTSTAATVTDSVQRSHRVIVNSQFHRINEKNVVPSIDPPIGNGRPF